MIGASEITLDAGLRVGISSPSTRIPSSCERPSGSTERPRFIALQPSCVREEYTQHSIFSPRAPTFTTRSLAGSHHLGMDSTLRFEQVSALGVFGAYFSIILWLAYLVFSSIRTQAARSAESDIAKTSGRRQLFSCLTLGSLIHTWYCEITFLICPWMSADRYVFLTDMFMFMFVRILILMPNYWTHQRACSGVLQTTRVPR